MKARHLISKGDHPPLGVPVLIYLNYSPVYVAPKDPQVQPCDRLRYRVAVLANKLVGKGVYWHEPSGDSWGDDRSDQVNHHLEQVVFWEELTGDYELETLLKENSALDDVVSVRCGDSAGHINFCLVAGVSPKDIALQLTHGGTTTAVFSADDVKAIARFYRACAPQEVFTDRQALDLINKQTVPGAVNESH